MYDNEKILYTETKNYKFRKDSPENYYDVGVVNNNLDKIDEIIKSVKDENTNVQSDWNVTATNSDAYIKNKPTSLPANGGNADTVDGKHAADFAPSGFGLGSHCKYVTGNWNDYIETGFYSGNNMINQPWQITSGALYCYMFVIKHDSNWVMQMAFQFNSSKEVYIRNKTGQTWTYWQKINDSGNADTVDGKHANEFATTSQITTINTALNNKVDKVSGKGLSTNDFTAAYKTKLDGIATGAETNVQSDWNVTATNSDAFIKNKPTSFPANGGNADTVDGKHASEFAAASQITNINNALNNKVDKVTGKGLSTNDFTAAYKTKLDGIANGADANVQSDWNITDTNSDAFIKNKPQNLVNKIELPTMCPQGIYKEYKSLNLESNSWYPIAFNRHYFRANGLFMLTVLHDSANLSENHLIFSVSASQTNDENFCYAKISILTNSSYRPIINKIRVTIGGASGFLSIGIKTTDLKNLKPDTICIYLNYLGRTSDFYLANSINAIDTSSNVITETAL